MATVGGCAGPAPRTRWGLQRSYSASYLLRQPRSNYRCTPAAVFVTSATSNIAVAAGVDAVTANVDEILGFMPLADVSEALYGVIQQSDAAVSAQLAGGALSGDTQMQPPICCRTLNTMLLPDRA